MPISGLVVTLAEESHLRQQALEAIRRRTDITLGPQAGACVPLVVETADEEEDRQAWEWLHSLPGVAMVSVAFIHFDREEESSPTVAGRGRPAGAESSGSDPSDPNIPAKILQGTKDQR